MFVWPTRLFALLETVGNCMESLRGPIFRTSSLDRSTTIPLSINEYIVRDRFDAPPELGGTARSVSLYKEVSE